MSLRSHAGKAALTAAALLLAVPAADAHPHVWVMSKSVLMFAPDGAVKAVRHAWTFDEMFSAFATQGLDKDNDGKLSREELAELAKVNVTSLKEFGFFTVGKSGNKDVTFDEPVDYWLEAGKDNVLTLHFTLPVKSGGAKGNLTLEVYDPIFFIDFSFAEQEPVRLADAPAGCTAEVKRPQSASATNLSESFFNSLSATSNFGAQFANRISLTCK